ncbi:MAG: FKBP-type peptidyl-prolyl cis-trans isomerase [Bacteroidota bacterium]|nr:FKBP-type peptidyl-prolyl cis-trans isomerase [Bacteroidota bacterium]
MNKLLYLFSCLILFSFFTSCSTSSYPGFLQTQSGLHYKFFSLGGGDLPKQFDYLRVKYHALSVDDYTFAVTGEKNFQINYTSKKGGIEEAIMMLNEGDSAAFVFPAEMVTSFFNIDSFPGQPKEVLLNMKLDEITPAEQYLKQYKKLKEWVNIKDIHEQKTLKKYLTDNNISEDMFSDGIYFISEKPGNGDLITDGIGVLINYRGYFLNGEIFDDTFEDKKPFDLVVGTSDQVISGLEIAIKKMKMGAKAKIIIPSHLAFGNKGSSTGVVPPNTTVIYQIEVLRVNN